MRKPGNPTFDGVLTGATSSLSAHIIHGSVYRNKKPHSVHEKLLVYGPDCAVLRTEAKPKRDIRLV